MHDKILHIRFIVIPRVLRTACQITRINITVLKWLSQQHLYFSWWFWPQASEKNCCFYLEYNTVCFTSFIWILRQNFARFIKVHCGKLVIDSSAKAVGSIKTGNTARCYTRNNKNVCWYKSLMSIKTGNTARCYNGNNKNVCWYKSLAC